MTLIWRESVGYEKLKEKANDQKGKKGEKKTAQREEMKLQKRQLSQTNLAPIHELGDTSCDSVLSFFSYCD